MRCAKVRDILLDSGQPAHRAGILEHLAICPACSAYAEDHRLLTAGFGALAAQSIPDASVGFAARLVRRLGDAADSPWARQAFLETVGQRFVYAALLLTLTLLLALALPSSGPLRAPTSSEIYFAQPEAIAAQNDSIFLGQSAADTEDLSPRILNNGDGK